MRQGMILNPLTQMRGNIGVICVAWSYRIYIFAAWGAHIIMQKAIRPETFTFVGPATRRVNTPTTAK
jgi:hypothetical protein